jgi:hypothetical protein
VRCGRAPRSMARPPAAGPPGPRLRSVNAPPSSRPLLRRPWAAVVRTLLALACVIVPLWVALTRWHVLLAGHPAYPRAAAPRAGDRRGRRAAGPPTAPGWSVAGHRAGAGRSGADAGARRVRVAAALRGRPGGGRGHAVVGGRRGRPVSEFVGAPAHSADRGRRRLLPGRTRRPTRLSGPAPTAGRAGAPARGGQRPTRRRAARPRRRHGRVRRASRRAHVGGRRPLARRAARGVHRGRR